MSTSLDDILGRYGSREFAYKMKELQERKRKIDDGDEVAASRLDRADSRTYGFDCNEEPVEEEWEEEWEEEEFYGRASYYDYDER